jgi:hypothetical protein
MIAEVIAFVLRDFPAVMLVLALILGPLLRGPETLAASMLSWILLLPIGFTGIWAAIYHLFFPAVAAADIGWQTSPFQFEVGMADLAIGVTACLAYRHKYAFKVAAVIAASISLLGDAVGHVFTDVICPLLAIGLLITTRRQPVRR